MAKAHSSRRKPATVTDIRTAIRARTDVEPITATSFPDFTNDVLHEVVSRVYEAMATLELCSELITSTGGPLDPEEGSRVMRAIDGALRTLDPVTDLICDTGGLAHSVNARISAAIEEEDRQRQIENRMEIAHE